MEPKKYRPGAELIFPEASGEHYITVKAPDVLDSNYIFILPTSTGPGSVPTLDGVNTWTNTNTFAGVLLVFNASYFTHPIIITRTGTFVPATQTPVMTWKTDGNAAGQGCYFDWISNKSDSTPFVYGQIVMTIVDPDPSTASGKITYRIARNNILFDALVIGPTHVEFNNPIKLTAYTSGTLPTSPVAGMMGYLTDAAPTPAYLAPAVGGGSIVAPIFYNGSIWVYH